MAQRRPDLVRKLVLAEPGGDLDASLAASDSGAASFPPLRVHVAAAAEKIGAGDIDGGLSRFLDGIEGEGVWRRLPAAAQQELRDNPCTLPGQLNDQRQPYSRADAESIRVPTLFIGGQKTPGSLPMILRALAPRMCRARGWR